ncbi:flippase-like domain-containing protein [Methanogenium sp. S4BF]|uniref:lysylphosphatidylglycerol synthase transmembrane domain-containing protein n=1 Tax=Methanogenium sp. S4BF TaxID=1789226 RepID=UPI002416B2E5|nr:lysylphosphatidylglycerol synthase transmembrane domain-containing protein [Methanogenium sp. S4BF]WFN34600.1 flippase-like domain-containing protein [Methanogenium sp. S4BF]
MIKKATAIVLPTILAVGIIAFMLYRVWDDLLIAVQNAVWSYLILAVAICVGAWFLRGIRYRSILASLAVSVSLWLSTACIYLSQTANLIVPARLGDLIRLFILRHEADATYTSGLSSVVVERFFDIVTIALLGAVTLPFVLNVPDWFITVIYVALGLCGIFVLVLFSAGRLQSENKYLKAGIDLLNQVKAASLSAKGIVGLSALSIVIWLTDVVICYIIALMFGAAIPFVVVTLAIVIGNLVKAVPVTPGGVGTYEIAVALTLSLAGVDPAVATLIAVIDHLVKNGVTVAGGVASLYVFGDWAVSLLRRAFSHSLDVSEVK